MPKLNTTDLEQHTLKTSHYGFSAARIEDLGSSEYTLVTILVDDSSSVEPFKTEMEKTLKTVVDACKKSPRADNLMVRLCKFADGFEEVHGFKPLATVNKDEYDGVLGGGGMTALFDASENVVRATSAYSKKLLDNDFSVNGILFVITDGQDNRSSYTTVAVKTALQEAKSQETIESLVSVLVGVNSSGTLDQYLDTFKTEAGFTQYVSVGDATAQKLAKLAEFVSKSISSQSKSLGSGAGSVPLTF